MKKILTILIIVYSTTLLMAIELNHIPQISIEAGKVISLELEIRAGFEDLEKAEIFYREAGTQNYKSLEMERGSSSNPLYMIQVDDIVGFTSGFEYYFLVTAIDENTLTSRALQAEVNPYIVQIEEVKNLQEGFVLLSPDTRYSDIGKSFVIAISTFAFDEDFEKLEFFFDGKNVTDEADLYSNMLVYKAENVSQGSHTYFAKAYLKNGMSVDSPKWSTKVITKVFELPLNMGGKGIFKSYLMNRSSDYADDDDKRANFLLTLNGNAKWFGFNSKLYLSSLETHTAQSVNRYLLNLRVPHLDLNIGDYSPNYGSYIMFGKNIRGLHSKLDFKNFRLLFSSGKTKRALKVSNANTVGTFQRDLLSARMEIGSRRAFSMGVSFSKSKDDIDSIDEEDYTTTTGYSTTPKDNLIFGSDLNLALFKQRVRLGAEIAMSYYNSNIIGGAMSLDSINAEFDTDISLPVDPADFESLFIINKYIEPFMPGFSNLAYKTYLRAFFLNNLLNVSYSTVGSSFNALSTSHQQKDINVISVNDNLRLLNNQLSINLSVNISSDNVYDTKDVTTSTINYSSQILYRPIDIMHFQIGYCSNNTTNDDDTSDFQSNSIMFGSSYKVVTMPYAPTRFSINFTNSANEEVVENTIDSQLNNISISANSVFEDLPLKTKVTYALSLNNNEVVGFQTETAYNSLYIKGEYSLLEDKLTPYVDFRFASFGGDYDRSSVMLNLGSSYKLTPQTFFSTNVGLVNYANDLIEYNAQGDVINTDYNQYNWKLTISQKF